MSNRLICAECTVTEDPLPWCDCRDGDQCRGPCRQRAHGPERCPFLSAMVPFPVPWSTVAPGHVIFGKDGTLMMVTGAGQDGDRWRIDVAIGYGGRTLTTQDPDRPVPVLVPYAERVAMLTLRENGVRHTVLSTPAGGGS